MCNESCDAVFGDHAHAQLGAEDKRIVVQQDLLHFHGERAARLCVKCLRKRSRQRFQLRAVIGAVVVRRTVETMVRKKNTLDRRSAL